MRLSPLSAAKSIPRLPVLPETWDRPRRAIPVILAVNSPPNERSSRGYPSCPPAGNDNLFDRKSRRGSIASIREVPAHGMGHRPDAGGYVFRILPGKLPCFFAAEFSGTSERLLLPVLWREPLLSHSPWDSRTDGIPARPARAVRMARKRAHGLYGGNRRDYPRRGGE